MKMKSNDEIGLCQTCQHAKVIQTSNRSRFYLCLLSKSHPNFEKYPRLPMRACRGYHPQTPCARLKTSEY
ncbi:MAG: hypothetical protein O7E52_01220 [Candidatus Poribacteria bacterium]|nr:hypothetical protein [Candidatus Poribacteria bacterium]